MRHYSTDHFQLREEIEACSMGKGIAFACFFEGIVALGVLVIWTLTWVALP